MGRRTPREPRMDVTVDDRMPNLVYRVIFGRGSSRVSISSFQFSWMVCMRYQCEGSLLSFPFFFFFFLLYIRVFIKVFNLHRH